MCSFGYNRYLDEYLRCERSDERSPEFSRRLYFNDHRNSQCSFDMNNYFFQTAEYDRFKIKRQDIDIFDFQFSNLKS